MNDKSKRLDKRFLLLGDTKVMDTHTTEKKLKKIIRRDQRSKLPGIWGTIGWKNDKDFEAEIQNSKEGNTNAFERDISTTDIIDNIKSFNSEIKNDTNNILERYINLDKTEFDIKWNEIEKEAQLPELRLDLFVDDDEGAMVYYHHQLKENFGLKNDEAVFEQFIQCKKTDDNYTTKRDRLSYIFKVLPPKKYTLNENSSIIWDDEEARDTTFIIKIITFKRSGKTPKEILKKFFDAESLIPLVTSKGKSAAYSLFGEKKYGLLVYDREVKYSSVAASNNERFDMCGAFFNVDEVHSIDRTKKTLLLIHGTFSNTLNTFRDLVRYESGSSELENFLNATSYEQVIAFNHPTISADVFDNLKKLKSLLGNETFTQSVSILSASRGCIFAQAIGGAANLPFLVDKSLMFSPANGVGYFNLGDKISTGLSILKKVTEGSPASYIFALLQFSSDYFMEQPGAQQMRFDSTSLSKVINSKPTSSDSKYIAVINDWEKGLIDTRGKRFWMRIADGIIKLTLGRKHDFVVGVKGQKNMPTDFDVSLVPMASTHCKYFSKGELHHRHGNEVIVSVFLSKYLN